jgi:hypothetical protein
LDGATPKLLEPSSPLSLGEVITEQILNQLLILNNLQEVPTLSLYPRTKKRVITCLLLNQLTKSSSNLTEQVSTFNFNVFGNNDVRVK